MAQRRSFTLLLAFLATALVAAPVADCIARTADFSVTVTGDEKFGAELKELVATTEKDRPSEGDVMAMLQGAQAQRQKLAQALRSRGFYGAEVTLTVGGRRLDDPEIVASLETRPESEKIPVVLTVNTGPIYRVANVGVSQAKPGAPDLPIDRTKLALAPGKPADSAAILAVEEQILDQTRHQGYALAEVAERRVVVDHRTQEVHVDFLMETGPIARMGTVRFSGTEKVDTAFLQRRVPYAPGEPYDPAKVRSLSDRLTSLGVFNSVRVKPAARLDEFGQLPIDVELRDRPPRTIGFGVAYETQRGLSVNAFWLHRNLFGEAESLRLGGEVNRLAQGSVADTGFALRAAFRKPDWWLSGQDATVDAEAVREIFDAYRRRAVTFGIGFDRTVTPRLRVKAGLSTEYSMIDRLGIARDYQLFGVPLGVILNHANSDTEPTAGWRLTANLTPYVDLGNAGQPFAIFRTTGTAYFDVAGSLGYEEVGRSVIATRASFGTIPGVRSDAIPPDKLFYAGGGGSVRGFTYQSAGPRNEFFTPLGGASLIEASLEFRQRIGSSFGVVAFLDAGSAYSSVLPDFSPLPRFGAGLGARYYTDFGPVRLDVGLPLNRREGDATFGIYVSLGQAF